MAEHAITEIVAVEQSAELSDVIGQMLRRYTGIFRKRDWFRLPFRVTQQANGFFTHVINAFNACQFCTNLPADNATLTLGNQGIEALAQ
ncbi:hypothetical protein D3C75_1269510 [compost metagenome]